MKSLMEALKQFEATEANVAKLETLWKEIVSMIPAGIAFGDSVEGTYDDRCRAFADVQKGLPMIDGWKLPVQLFALNEIAQMRFDTRELGEFEYQVSVEESIFEQEKYLQEYRYRLDKKRRQLIRAKLLETVSEADDLIAILSEKYPAENGNTSEKIEEEEWDKLKSCISVIDTLLGSSVKRPTRWSDLHRHLYFRQVGDFRDIQNLDWPAVRMGITNVLYGESDPVPVHVADIGTLVESEPSGDVVTKLKWDILSADDFERLIFCLITEGADYENPEWLTKTNAPDRGRDLSAMRVTNDSLSGTIRQRVIIQCKHWLSRSVNLEEVTSSRVKMTLWEPPKVDVLVIATSGRFTTDAIQHIEKHNQSDYRLRIEVWPESHLEKLLASRPALIGEFGLR